MYQETLKQQHSEIAHILRTLQIPKRHVRAINFLGSALKFVAGTPDHDDYTLLLTKQNTLIENSNKQNKINSDLQERINEISKQINELKKAIQRTKTLDKTPVFEILTNRNILIINYLNNLALSIVLAKNNLINPLILDEIDLNNLIEHENLQISISNILLVSKIKVLQNNNVIHYILKVPQISKFCDFLNIFPVSHDNKIVQIPTSTAAKCKDTSFPVNECVKTTTESICKPLTSPCMTDLLNSDVASCPTENSHHLPLIQQVNDGTIILNNVYPTTIIEKDNIVVRGTVLLIFSDIIQINKTVFKNLKNLSNLEVHPPKLLTLIPLQHTDKISLPYLHELNIQNTDLIKNINEDLESHTVLWWIAISLILTFSIMMLAIILKLLCCKKAERNPTKILSSEELKAMLDNINIRVEDTAI